MSGNLLNTKSASGFGGNFPEDRETNRIMTQFEKIAMHRKSGGDGEMSPNPDKSAIRDPPGRDENETGNDVDKDKFGFLQKKLQYQFMTPDDFDEASGISRGIIVGAFESGTSTHGIGAISMARGPIKKIFWIVVTLGALTGLVYNLTLQTQRFMDFPVSVGISIEHANDIDFPAITICNMSPVKLSASATPTKKRRKRSTAASSCCCSCCASINGSSAADACGTCGAGSLLTNPTCSSTTPAPSTSATPTRSISGYGGSQSTVEPTSPSTVAEEATTTASSQPTRPPPRADFTQSETLTETMSGLSSSRRQQMGFTMNDLILDCQFAGSNCDPSWFTWILNPILGNCYIFNSGWNDTSVLVSHRTGRRYGLSMTLNINQDEYVSSAGDTAAIRMLVHPGSDMPFPEDQGLMVSPGHSTSVALRKMMITRLGAPYSTCIDASTSAKNFQRNVYEEKFNNTIYSQGACQRTCYQQHVISTCQCGDPYYPLEGTAFGGAWKTCSVSNATQDNCRYGVLLDYNSNQISCDCPDACQEISYATSVSIGQWPSNVQLNATMESVASKVPFNVYDGTTYLDNLFKMEIFFEEFNFQVISETPEYELAQYLSDVGGVLGLYLGMSFMSVVEFIELFIDLGVFYVVQFYFWCKFERKKPPFQPPTQPPPDVVVTPPWVAQPPASIDANQRSIHDAYNVPYLSRPQRRHRRMSQRQLETARDILLRM